MRPNRFPAWGWALGILATFIGLGFWFSLVIPPFETPDEHYHYAFARHLAQGNPLPVQAAEATGPWAQEGSQAPLYYWLAGRLTAGIDQHDFEAIRVLNPRANLGDPLFPGNKNRMLYSAVDWPLRGANLALHMGRWLSLALGCVTLLALYATARLLWPTRRTLPLLALATAAWLPQFVFLSASFNNDTLVIALAALTVWRLVHMILRHGPPPATSAHQSSIPWWEWAIIGVLLGLAALSKLQGLGLWLLAALVGILLAWQRRDWRVLFHAALPVALPAVALAGWWYWRNITLYGDWTGLDHLASITGARTSPLTWSGWWREFRGLRYSSWGLFGWFNVLLPLWIYTVLDAVTLLALGGGVWQLVRRRAPRMHSPRAWAWGVVGLWTLISAGALLYWISRAEGSQGRLIFPALTALVLLLTAGLHAWRDFIPAPIHRGLTLAWPAFLLACTLYSGAILLPRTYAAPPPVADIPATATAVDFSFGADRGLHIRAIEVAPGHYTPGDSVPVTLYMQRDAAPEDSPSESPPTHPAQTDYQVFIQFLDATGTELGNLTTHPGWGRNPTTLWTPGAIYADTYPVRFARTIDPHAPVRARIYVGFVNPATEESGRFPITAYDATGAEVDPPIAGHVILHPATPPSATELGLPAHGAVFGEAVALTAARVQPAQTAAGTQLGVQLLWTALAPPPGDLTAFVHVLDGDGNQITGYDAAPAPQFPTSEWQAGDIILTEWLVDLPSTHATDEWHVWVGLYPTESQGAARLPVTSSAGQETQHEMVKVEG